MCSIGIITEGGTPPSGGGGGSGGSDDSNVNVVAVTVPVVLVVAVVALVAVAGYAEVQRRKRRARHSLHKGHPGVGENTTVRAAAPCALPHAASVDVALMAPLAGFLRLRLAIHQHVIARLLYNRWLYN